MNKQTYKGSATPWRGAAHVTRRALRGLRRCDVAIIGGGITGLSAACELLAANPDLDVVLLEARHVAAGASGRGTGLLGPRIGPPLTVARKRYGDTTAAAAFRWSESAVQHVLDIIAKYDLACFPTLGSQLIVAADEAAMSQQIREAAAAADLGLDVALLSPGELPAIAARYSGGLRYGPAATLDPAAFTTELATVAEQHGLVIFENSPVRHVRLGLGATLIGDNGAVAAKQVLFALNGYAGELRAPSGVVGLTVQAGVTAALPPAVLAELQPLHNEPLIEAGELSPYYRLTTDHRLVVGGGAVRRGVGDGIALEPSALISAVRRLSPALADVEIASTWSGPIGMTRDGMPVAGQHSTEPSLFYAGGCCGHGLAMSAMTGAFLGRWMGDCIDGDPTVELPWVRPSAPWMPRGPMVDFALDRVLSRMTTSATTAIAN